MRDDFTACLVTRGDVDLQPIREPLEQMPGCRVIVYDNAASGSDRAVFGRYVAADAATTDLIYVQDDDVILPTESIAELLKAWRPGHLAANMPARFRHDFYVHHCLVGFGAVFEKSLMQDAFRRFWAYVARYRWNAHPLDQQQLFTGDGRRRFERTCDVAFTALVPRILVDVPYIDLEYGSAPNRMWKQPEHVGERKRMLELARAAS